ncbi:hypothetical protein Bbelb_262880 [Branchiostoma belcheri]|nr:hypothetical protein Bbelb_262880 [Branchiostoma belcheri]
MAAKLFLGTLAVLLWCHKAQAENFTVLIVQPGRATYPWRTQSLAPYVLDQIEPTVAFAIEELQENGVLGDNTFHIDTFDSACSYYIALTELLDTYYEDSLKPNVIIGPTCLYVTTEVSRLASHWDVPVLTAGAPASGFRHSDFGEYRTVTRMEHTDNKLADVVGSLLVELGFNSTRVALVYPGEDSDSDVCYYRMQAIRQKLAAEQTARVVLDRTYSHTPSFGFYLNEVEERARAHPDKISDGILNHLRQPSAYFPRRGTAERAWNFRGTPRRFYRRNPTPLLGAALVLKVPAPPRSGQYTAGTPLVATGERPVFSRLRHVGPLFMSGEISSCEGSLSKFPIDLLKKC